MHGLVSQVLQKRKEEKEKKRREKKRQDKTRLLNSFGKEEETYMEKEL